ncbi:MAG: beta-lactamase family protein [Roseofilum sp. Belize BBD 4]|nr:beta-lactamase family protein [Roseofilum sp. Belize BBD 4]
MSINIFTTIGSIARWVAIVMTIVMVEVFWIARPAVPRGDLATIKKYLIQKLSQPGKPKLGSAALILIQKGEVVAAHAFGIANAAKKIPVQIDRTIYQMASVSKMVTAWGVMKLVEEGRIALDKPANQYLKRWQFPVSQYSDKVTIRHLLSHTGGLDDLFGYAGFLPGESIQSLEESLTLTQDSMSGKPRGVTVAREPGRNWLYSGGGYTVLQLLIEDVTQESFSDYMKKAILEPLGMRESSFDWEAIAASGRTDRLATSFDEKLQPSPHRRYTATAAASLYATPQDMARFVQAYSRTNLVLKQETLKQMINPQPGAHQDWGLGHTLYVAHGADEYTVGHDGGNLPALGHTVRVNPATGNGIVLLISGNLELASQLGDDWVYWETGKLPMNAKWRILGSRLVPALVGIGLGALAIATWSVQ